MDHLEQRGFTILELLSVLSVTGILSVLMVASFRELNDPLQNSANQLVTQLKHARVKAIASTSAILVRPSSLTRIEFLSGPNCDDTPNVEGDLTLDFPSGVSLADASWSLCFNSRGLSDVSVDIDVEEGSRFKVVEVLVGGSILVQRHPS